MTTSQRLGLGAGGEGPGAGLIAFSLILLCLGGCTDRGPATGESPIPVGLIAPVAGGDLGSGSLTVEGATLAAGQINAGGGVDLGNHRRPIRLIVEDTVNRPETAVSKAFRLVDHEGVVALVGLPVSDSARAVARVAEARRIPLVSTASTNPATTHGKSFAFRVIFPDPVQGHILAEFAYQDLGARVAGVLFDPGTAYSRGLAAAFRFSFESLGGEVAVEESYMVGDSDVASRLRRVAEAGAEVLLVPVYQALLPPLMRQARAMGIEIPVLGGDTWSNIPARNREGWSPAYYSDVWAPEAPNAVTRRFVRAYEETYGKPATSYAALAYDGVYLVARAIESQKSAEPASIRAGLLSLTDFVGATGAIRYDQSGDPARSAVIMQLAPDGRARLHEKLESEVAAR